MTRVLVQTFSEELAAERARVARRKSGWLAALRRGFDKSRRFSPPPSIQEQERR